MTTWTPAAREELERQLERVRGQLGGGAAEGGGAVLVDAAEVVDDLRRHVDEEFGKRRVSVVTADEVRRVLAQIGVGGEVTGAVDHLESGERLAPRNTGGTPVPRGQSRKPLTADFFTSYLSVQRVCPEFRSVRLYTQR